MWHTAWLLLSAWPSSSTAALPLRNADVPFVLGPTVGPGRTSPLLIFDPTDYSDRTFPYFLFRFSSTGNPRMYLDFRAQGSESSLGRTNPDLVGPILPGLANTVLASQLADWSNPPLLGSNQYSLSIFPLFLLSFSLSYVWWSPPLLAFYRWGGWHFRK